MDESDRKKLLNVLSDDNRKLKLKYEIIKETVVDKLELLKENEDDKEVLSRINETLNKLENEEFDKINYIKLYELNKNI